MIHTVQIAGYRGFRRFEMTQLGCVNLLVGKNNSGKSSLLEAMYLLASGGDPAALWRVLQRRGERLDFEPSGRPMNDPEVDLSHLFYGHEINTRSSFQISTMNGAPDRTLKYEVGPAKEDEERNLFTKEKRDRPDLYHPRLVLRISGRPLPVVDVVKLTRYGGLGYDSIDTARHTRGAREDTVRPAYFVSTESLNSSELTVLWNDIVLTSSESLVIEALRFLDAKIERIASVSQPPSYYYSETRGGFKVKFSEVPNPVPIGSLGDGTWRLLSLTIALIKARNGVLLIDEIDTGLHYSVMSSLWRLIQHTASEYNVQVFATTHSYDCVHALAKICNPEIYDNTLNRVSIQRVEYHAHRSVPFTEAEIWQAAKDRIEIR